MHSESPIDQWKVQSFQKENESEIKIVVCAPEEQRYFCSLYEYRYNLDFISFTLYKCIDVNVTYVKSITILNQFDLKCIYFHYFHLGSS